MTMSVNTWEVKFNEPTFVWALIVTVLAPTIWNILARIEYYTHLLTKIAFGSRYLGCYLLAAWIFSFSIYRDYVFERALELQSTSPLLDNVVFKGLGAVAFVFGSVLVLTSMYRLGVTGTYLGDYFGILMDNRVTGFPFNVTSDPMYNGSSLCFVGSALWKASPAGLVLAAAVYFMYQIALVFEGPFTTAIYVKRDQERKKTGHAGAKTATTPSPSKNQHRTVSPSRKPRKED
eukprot:ANDGO_07089.mRNA.1 Phosphatidyl-N-methylethanolamine N-methyltransferase